MLVASLHYAGARYYMGALGRWTSTDPLADGYPGHSPYNYSLNNPTNLVDPTGAAPNSTHTDEDGNVLAVYNDGDTGVYRHEDATSKEDIDENREETGMTAGGGEKMGETETWDEFAAREGTEATPILTDASTNAHKPLTAQIQFDERWAPVLAGMNRQARGLDPLNLALESSGGGYFDLKRSAEYGSQGRLLGGYYTSSRSGGNFLAGLNARTAGFSFETFQRIAGGLHRAGKVGAGLAAFGKKYGPAPMYGEVEVQYRWSKRGYNAQFGGW